MAHVQSPDKGFMTENVCNDLGGNDHPIPLHQEAWSDDASVQLHCIGGTDSIFEMTFA